MSFLDSVFLGGFEAYLSHGWRGRRKNKSPALARPGGLCCRGNELPRALARPLSYRFLSLGCGPAGIGRDPFQEFGFRIQPVLFRRAAAKSARFGAIVGRGGHLLLPF